MNSTEFHQQNVTPILLRGAVAILAVALAFIAVALYFRWPMVEDIWPWNGYYSRLSPLSYFFLSSIAAAVCAPMLWIAITGKLYAATPGAINLTVAFGGIATFMFQSYLANPSNPRVFYAALTMSGVVIFIVVSYLLGRKMRGSDTRPLPPTVRYSFCGFIVALLLVGGGLVLKTPNIIPWQVTVEGSVVYGWIFLGAAAYFVYAVVRPTWENGAGQLLGFLAYDIVLILPFIRHFSDVPSRQRLNLIIYTAVVVYSGLLAIYYLFVNPKTRLGQGTERAQLL